MTFPRPTPGLLWALAGALLTGLVLHTCSPAPIGPALVQVDTADASAWRARAHQLDRAMTDSVGRLATLRRQLAGIETRRPTRVMVYDTVLSLVTDTVILAVSVDGSGRLTQELALPDSGGHRPATAAPIRVGDCDDGYQLMAGRVQCNRARLGHLVAWVGAGVESRATSGLPPPIQPHGAAGLRWSPAYRSPWSAEVRIEHDGRTVASVRRGLALW